MATYLLLIGGVLVAVLMALASIMQAHKETKRRAQREGRD
jgi:hypothetical protein